MRSNTVVICLQKSVEQKDGAAGETVHFYPLFTASHCLIHCFASSFNESPQRQTIINMVFITLQVCDKEEKPRLMRNV